MQASKSKIDKSGKILSLTSTDFNEQYIEYEYIFDDFRRKHLGPLTELTTDLQNWLRGYGLSYYIAQRLKRKPQILRKLRRLSVRLSQLQDIGGCRIIVDTNEDVDSLVNFIKSKIAEESNFNAEK